MSELPEIFPGYRVVKLEENDPICFAYKIIGPRKEFFLMRNKPNPSMLFAVPEGRRSCKVRGYEWFTDKDGQLKPVR
jgi:hypothetical protein